MTLPNEMVIRWDGLKVVEVTMPANLAAEACGICGTVNGEGVSTGMTIGPHDSSHMDDIIGCASKAANGAVNTMVKRTQARTSSIVN